MAKLTAKDRPLNIPYIPKGDRVVILRISSETKSKGGIIIPDTAQEKAHLGWVVSVGPDVDNTKSGELINFGKYAGSEMMYAGVEYMIMRQSDLHGEWPLPYQP